MEAFLNEKESLFNRFYDSLGVLEEKVETANEAGTAGAGDVEAARSVTFEFDALFSTVIDDLL